VSGSLPKALLELSQDVRLLIPKYHDLKITGKPRLLSTLKVDNRFVQILETKMPEQAASLSGWWTIPTFSTSQATPMLMRPAKRGRIMRTGLPCFAGLRWKSP